RLDALQQQLAENRTTLHAELAATMVEPQFATLLDDDATQNLHLTINDLEARINAAALASVTAAVGAGADAVFIKSGLAGLTRVATAATTKMATSATIGTGCAAADGPLPIGDIIGAIAFAGGTAWTAWDLYQARIALPKEITREVTASMTASRDEVIRATREEGRRLFELHENGGRDIVAQLERQMQGGQP
ncbi:MAG: hypothetical protein PHC30_07780, partial [Lentisphaeria bacterium]|nr:hypothetical protein [Lentisphaeria bacterium]